MGRRFLLLSLISTLLFTEISSDGNILCSQCSCNPTNGTFYEVTCSKDVSNILYTNTSEIAASILKLSVTNNELIVLNKNFSFTNLVELDLSWNRIVHVADQVFHKLMKVERLILSHNMIEVLQPNAFKGEYVEGAFYPLRSLREIRLDNNNINTLDGDLFEHVPQLETLNLAFNPFKVIDTQTSIAITNLMNLKLLDLSYTQISSLPAHFMHTPKSITILNLTGNYFEKVPRALEEAHSLETLILNDNSFVNLTRENGFPEIRTLRVLHLCEMARLVEIGPGSLSNLTNLQDVYVAGNPRLRRIDDFALATANKVGTYTGWPTLKKLYLNDNQLTHLNRSLMAHWDTLAELDLSNNPWTCECENQWMVETLMPVYLEIDEERAKAMKCAAPIEMVSYTFHDIYVAKSHMRCLDLYGARPEKDAALLVGMLAGVLVGIPLVLFCIYLYKRHWFGIFDDSPAAFSRQFYTKTNQDSYNY